jgi:hypothetical protein
MAKRGPKPSPIRAECLRLYHAGRTAKAIARELGLALAAVNHHLRHVRDGSAGRWAEEERQERGDRPREPDARHGRRGH